MKTPKFIFSLIFTAIVTALLTLLIVRTFPCVEMEQNVDDTRTVQMESGEEVLQNI